MANVTKLTTGKAGGPPPEAAAPENTRKAPRDKTEPKGKIEFSVPLTVIAAFEAEAARRFGFKKGSKSAMFMALWRERDSKKSG